MTAKSGIVRRIVLILGSLLVLWVILLLWERSVEAEAHWTPEYEREDLEPLLERIDSALTDEDYDLILRQTGLGQPAIDQLWSEDRQSDILAFQSAFFADVEVQCQRYNLFVSGERLELSAEAEGGGDELGREATAPNVQALTEVQPSKPLLAPLREGDILITPNSHFFGWRNGHAAIVVEAPAASSSRLALESVTLGVKSKLRPLERWRHYPAFMVLRLRGQAEWEGASAGAVAAALAKEYFLDVPYQLTAGLWESPWELPEKGEAAPVGGTQCAHLIWSCYRALGYDLDSDGGWLVTPRDLMESPLLEVVQIYGMDPESVAGNVTGNHKNW